MKYILLFCFLSLQITSKAQALYAYKDTINGFSIGLPDSWRYWTDADANYPELKLRVYNMDSSLIGSFQDNFNIMIYNKQPADIESSYNAMIQYKRKNDMQLVDTGSYIVYGERMRWFDEVHTGKKNNDTLCNSVFAVYSNNKTYIITFTCSRLRFRETRNLFHQVAQTFKTKLPPAYESLNIVFPEITKWSMVYETDDSATHATIIMPQGETIEKWTSSVTNVSYKGRLKESIEKTIERFAASAKAESKEAKLTVLSKAGNWALFKIESNKSEPGAYLYYVAQGNSALHAVYFTLKQATLPADIIKKWSDIFRTAKLVTGR